MTALEPTPAVHPLSAGNAPAPAEVTAWFNYRRPETYDVVVEKVNVPTRAGSNLSCDRYRPGRGTTVDPGRHPGLILDYWPYGTRELPSTVNRATYYARHGYDVLVCDVAGTGQSPGVFTTWFQPEEAQDNYDLIEWLAAQPNSTGKIAQTGGSYGAITAYRVAALRPPHLVTIVPEDAPANIYGEFIYPGGIPSHMAMGWAMFPAIPPLSRGNILASFQDHRLYDEFWQQVAIAPKLASITLPILYLGGYFDIFRDGGFATLRERPADTWLVYGPWDHLSQANPPGFPAAFGADGLSAAAILQWLDHWMLGLESADLPPSAVTSFESTSTQDGPFHGEWRSFTQWPPRGSQQLRLYPTLQGGLSIKAPAQTVLSYNVNPTDGPSAGLYGSLPWDPAVDQTQPDTFERATFTLAPFDRDITLAGPVTLHLRASMAMKDTYFVSKLEVVTASGQTLPIESGYLRARLRESLSEATAVPTNTLVDYTICLGDTHWKFNAGEQLRITIAGGDTPIIVSDAPAGVVNIQIGPGTYVDAIAS